MVSREAANEGVEWRVTIPDGATVKLEPESRVVGRAWRWLVGLVVAVKLKVLGFAEKVWKIGADDPRKVIHGFKVGLALCLVSLFYYTRPLYDGVGGNAMWAVMTVVVIFDFSVGACLYKGFNRAMATFTGGSLALGIHYFADKSGKTCEPIILGAAVFLLASAATFSRFLPIVKKRFDYGITIFILTFSLVSVSGYRVNKLFSMAQQRLSTIAIGISICFLVCIFICPVWAGGDLHLLITRNIEKLGDSLEGCIAEYFDGSKRSTGEKSKSQGYKCVLNSKATEDSQANLAIWEPAHGRFGFRHPWKQYLKLGAALRYCACCIEALNGCMNSDVQAPEYIKKHLHDACLKLSSEACKVLKESASSIKSMKKSSIMDVLVAEMNTAVEELHTSLRTLPNRTAASAAPQTCIETTEKKTSISTAATVTFMEALPVVAIATLLIEISTRTEAVVDAVEDLASLAGFEPADDHKPISNSNSINAADEQGDMKALQQV